VGVAGDSQRKATLVASSIILANGPNLERVECVSSSTIEDDESTLFVPDGIVN
jgi:hypothetical protein